MPRYIDADKLIAHLKDEIEGCKQSLNSRANGKGIAYGTELGLKSAISFANTLATADVVPKSEVDKLEYTLTGVMHSVDKWLDGDELEQDEVNRAITMREKTLRIVEQYKDKVEDYKDCWYKIHDSYNTDCLESYNKGQQKGAWDVLNELRQEINDALECNQKRLKESEWAYDIVDRIGGKIDALRGIDGFIDELEEKYFDKDIVLINTESEDKG